VRLPERPAAGGLEPLPDPAEQAPATGQPGQTTTPGAAPPTATPVGP